MINIKTKEWFDRINGNTYFSAEVYLGNDLILSLPFQYGYDGARQAVENALGKHFGVSAQRWEVSDLLRRNGIELSETRVKALKRELSKETFEDLTPFYKPENLALYAAYRMREGIELKHHTMENCFVEAVYKDFVNIGVGLGIPFTEFNWF